MRIFLAIGLLLSSILVSAPLQANTILILGDSISAAFGIDKAQGWVSLLDKKLSHQCEAITVKNASVSGETTAGGLSRLPSLLRETKPSLVVVELGGNDGLRGLSPKVMQQNLQRMIQLSKEAGARVVVLGIHIPSNFGAAYRTLFDQAYVNATQAEDVPLLPFLLSDVYEKPDMMQEDGIHPTASAQPILLTNAWQVMGVEVKKICPTLALAP
ncbi:MAG: arylesterase [Alcanivoracaceae bacterium]|nr:arylesterase [Alcanivoracaceae bacterium]